MNWLDSISSTLLQKDLDGLWCRQQVISDNMANFETPGYKQKTVSFESELRNAMEASKASMKDTMARVGSVQPVTAEDKSHTYRADGNGVDLEQQMTDMFRTTSNYSYSIQQMSDYFSRLRTAITGDAK
jgi:flagellar basal-body rod protein FlgB